MTDFNFKPKQGRQDFGWYNLNGLPHFDGPEQPQFVTFRLFDSLPAQVVEKLRTSTKSDAAFRKRIERYLDSGFGECWLRDGKIAGIVRDALKYNDRKTYDLIAWVLMPNHVHVVLQPRPAMHLPDIVHSIKSFSAQMANRALGRTGQFWQHESFDRYIRDRRHLAAAIRCTEMNPVKAGLCKDPEEWTFSSAFERQKEMNGKQGCLPSSQ
ncbi:MAG: transposase [Pyrinomonadaceae bacterium]|nr:transposase [Pyrinomonadaceae bacterium]